MRKIVTLCTVLAMAFFVLNGFITQASNQDSFWNKAAQAGMAEVMLGNLALQKSSNEEIKQIAQKIVDDHTAANDELKQLAATKNATLATEVNAKQKATYAKLVALSGADFDKEYVKVTIKDHESAIKLFQRQADQGDDADVKAFAAKTLPTLQGHLQMARSLSDSMKNMKSNDSNRNSNSNSNSNSDMNMNSNSMNSNSMNMNSNSMNMNGMNMNSNSNRRDSNRNSNSNSNRNMNNMNMNSNSNSNRNMNSNTNSNSNDNRK